MIASSYSVSQASSDTGFTLTSARWTASSPRTSQPASISISTSGLELAGGPARPNSRAAGGGAAHLGVQQDRLRHFQIGGVIDIDVVDALEMRKHRHPRLGFDPR